MRLSCAVHLGALVAMSLVAAGCKDDDSPTGPSAVGGTTSSGVPQVRGTERLAWNQVGDTSKLRFRAYVDNRGVDLPGVSCKVAFGGESECAAPLPALTDGVHTIELVNIFVTSNIESARSEAFTVQKVAARSSSAAMPLAFARGGRLHVEPVITIADGLSFTADIVATGVRAPAQLAALPDGRLLLSDADGRVRVVRPGQPDSRDAALEAGALSGTAVAPMGLASHPDFAQNRLVYVSLLERDRSDRPALRVVRLREVGDALGEAATLFESPVAGDAAAATAGPRTAFGPDRLLYVMLPPGLEFVDEPAASTPRASMVRLTDEGRAAGEPLADVTATPLAFTWHPATGALWMMFRGADGVAAVRSLGGRERASTMRADAPALRAREVVGPAGSAVVLQSAPDDLVVAQALLGTRADGSRGLARLALPLLDGSGGVADNVGDIVAGDGGMLFVATSNGLAAGVASDAVVRLRPVPAR